MILIEIRFKSEANITVKIIITRLGVDRVWGLTIIMIRRLYFMKLTMFPNIIWNLDPLTVFKSILLNSFP